MKSKLTIVLIYAMEILMLAVMIAYTVYIVQIIGGTLACRSGFYSAENIIVNKCGVHIEKDPEIVDALLTEAKNGKGKEFAIKIPGNIPSNMRGHEYLREIVSENPEVFGKYDVKYYQKNGKCSHLYLTYSKKKDQETQKLMEAVYDICEEARQKPTRSEQIVYVVDRISKACTYDMHTYSNEDAYGCLVLGRAKCTGYAESLQLCMKELGIPSRYKVAVNLKHIWNQVKVNGKWIDIDATVVSSRQKRLKLIIPPEKGII